MCHRRIRNLLKEEEKELILKSLESYLEVIDNYENYDENFNGEEEKKKIKRIRFKIINKL